MPKGSKNKYEIFDDFIYMFPTNKPNDKYVFDKNDYEIIKEYTWFDCGRNLVCQRNNKLIRLVKVLFKTAQNEKIIFNDDDNHNYRRNNVEIVNRNRNPKKRNPSKIIEYDEYIAVVANNTGNEHVFPKEYKEILSNIGWSEDSNGHLGGDFYGTKIKAYWLITGTPINKLMVDHIDQNPRNNLEYNLRVTTSSINTQNRKLMKNNTSGFVGVHWNKFKNKWVAQIFNRIEIYLGSFSNKIDAAKEYDKKAVELFGENATTNKKLGLL